MTSTIVVTVVGSMAPPALGSKGIRAAGREHTLDQGGLGGDPHTVDGPPGSPSGFLESDRGNQLRGASAVRPTAAADRADPEGDAVTARLRLPVGAGSRSPWLTVLAIRESRGQWSADEPWQRRGDRQLRRRAPRPRGVTA